MAAAFVVQHHVCPQGDHYDWMLERAGGLITFQMSVRLGDLIVGQAVDVRRLGEHRRAYLTYEGPVSGGRGSVRIDDRGTYEATGQPDARWLVRVRGQHAAGRLSLDRVEGDAYRLTRLE